MARLKALCHSDDLIILKPNRPIMVFDDSQILDPVLMRARLDKAVSISAKFDNCLFTGLSVSTALKHNGIEKSVASSRVIIYLVDNDTWQESLIAESVQSVISTRFNYSFIIASLSGFLSDGSQSLRIDCEMYRLGKIYRGSQIFNNLSIFRSIKLIKREVEFIDITKVDE